MSERLIGVPLPELAPFCRKIAAEGAVLLKNENHLLPLQQNEKISVFGRCQIEYYRSGTGSGGAVNVEYETNIIDSLKESGVVCVNEELEQIYRNWLRENPFDDGGGGWAAEPWNQKEMLLTDEILAKARAFSPKAVLVIGRTAGEDKDNMDTQGSYRLTDEELTNIRKLAQYYDEIIVLLNVANIIDMKWLLEESVSKAVKTVMFVWQGGMEGGRAVADVLTGKVCPSGHLTDTIAYELEDYPSSQNFGGKTQNIYAEDIYIGYRYFETFAPDKVWYPFGFGLSYTEFEQKNAKAQICGEQIRFTVDVSNTGTYAGKQCIQVYVEAPQGKLGRPARELIGFAKTELLAPMEQAHVEITVPIRRLAAYDDGGITGEKSCFVLESGCYRFYLGDNVRDAKAVELDGRAGYQIDSLMVVERLEEALAPVVAYKRMKPGMRKEDGSYELTYEDTPLQTIDLRNRILSRLPEQLSQTGNKGIVLKDVAKGEATLDQFLAQLSDKELCSLVRAEGMSSPKVTPGTASAFGGMSDALAEYGFPMACTSDGPSGIRMESGLKATQMPIGTLLACTWNIPAMEQLYMLEGQELLRNEVDTLLGPGINIHRSPLNGRNFEYFSEDPYLTGCFASAVTKGLREGGSAATLKHFAANNQETDRFLVNSVVSERALREIYLKGFEMAVREGGAVSVMTSYNPINGFQAASNYDLTTTILREQWGFKGIAMTDWWAYMNDVISYGPGNRQDTASMVRAQNDLYMVVDNNGAEKNVMGDNLEQSLESGRLTRGELQRCARNICFFLMQAPCFERNLNSAGALLIFEPGQKVESAEFELTESVRIPTVDGEARLMHVQKDGIYSVHARVMSPLADLAQTTTNVLLDGKLMTTIQIGGTNGEWIENDLLKIGLKAGTYAMSLEYAKAGMEVEWIGFQYCKELP